VKIKIKTTTGREGLVEKVSNIFNGGIESIVLRVYSTAL
jgi:hypothetical protein